MKKITLLLVFVLIAAMFAGCNNTAGENGETKVEEVDKNEVVEVTILGTIKSEIGEQFEEALAFYNESQSKYKITVIPMDGSNPFEKMTALYASGNAPTIMVMGQEMAEFQDRLLDLSDTEFTKLAFPGTTDNATFDGKVLGMPVTVEGFGLLYNKEVLDLAVGGDFDPASVKTRSDLKELFDKIEAAGKTAVHLSPMDWSLGAHISNKMFSTQSADAAERVQFMTELKNGEMNLVENQNYNGWLDTLDLLIEYNINRKSPLSADYDAGSIDLANGNVGFWFMGNWAYAPLHELNTEGTFGVMPYPISDNADDYGNNQISVGVPMYIVIDAEQSTTAEQEGAIDFLNWLVTSAEGQEYYVSKMNFIPTFDGFNSKPEDYMSNEILSYVSEGMTLEWMNMKYPADGWPAMGASMQKYLDGVIDRDGLAAEFEEYWKNVD